VKSERAAGEDWFLQPLLFRALTSTFAAYYQAITAYLWSGPFHRSPFTVHAFEVR
jgi:hypothetical protein